MPRKFENLESTMLLFSGGYGVLVAILLLQFALWPLLLSLVLMAMGVYRRRKPARSKRQWLIDAWMTILIVAALFADSSTGGGAGPYLFLILLLAMCFPMLMETKSMLLFAALLLTVYFAFGSGSAWKVSPMLFALRGVLIAGFCLLAARFGKVLRQSEDSVELLRRDVESGAYNEHGWLRYGTQALRSCRAGGQALSLSFMSMPHDWTDQIMQARRFVSARPQELRKLRAKALSEMTQQLMANLPSNSLVGRDARGNWVLVMPGFSSQECLKYLDRQFGRPMQINFGPRIDEMFVAFTACVVQAQDHETLHDLHARAEDIWNRGVQSGAV
jgi:uncharacterized membrane protein